MKILYFGSACDEDWFEKVSALKAMPSHVAQYMFEMALIKGISTFNDIDMKMYYLFQEPYYPKGNFLRFKSRKKNLNEKYIVTYIPYLNIPVLKEIFYFIKGMTLTLKWAIKNNSERNKIILTPFNYTPLSFGIFIIAKIMMLKRANIFTDLSNDIINDKRQIDMIWFKRLILPFYLKLVSFLERNYDLYILFTEPMNQKVNPQDKPYLVMEGIFNNKLNLSNVQKEKAVMYAGSLSFEYGVKIILDAFEQIKDDDLQLWLFGDGDMKEYIKELCERDCRVQYFGFKPREEVFEYEKKATLLLNIRNPKDEYTMYSFPSKTFEYMASGTPFLTTKLRGIPEEYYEYIYTIDNYDVESLKGKIQDIMSKPRTELDYFGLRARQFILHNKNSVIQAKKVINKIYEINNMR